MKSDRDICPRPEEDARPNSWEGNSYDNDLSFK
jgi:hypothetical protein